MFRSLAMTSGLLAAFSMAGTRTFFASSGIPDEAKKVLVPAIEKAANNPEVMAKLRNMRIIPNYKPPEELRKMISEDYENARHIVKQMKITK